VSVECLLTRCSLLGAVTGTTLQEVSVSNGYEGLWSTAMWSEHMVLTPIQMFIQELLVVEPDCRT
jgi:hypothetical protein